MAETNHLAVYAAGDDARAQVSKTRKAETKRRHAHNRLIVRQDAVHALELKLQVERTWLPTDARYKDVERYLDNRKFHQALNKLQGLVVQRLFEMQKANVPGLSTSIFRFLPLHHPFPYSSLIFLLHRLQASSQHLEASQFTDPGYSYRTQRLQRTCKESPTTRENDRVGGVDEHCLRRRFRPHTLILWRCGHTGEAMDGTSQP